jgi:hypothetical protein
MATIEFSDHARQQMIERGATETEVRLAIEQGDTEPAREGRTMHRKSVDFEADWRGRHYRSKQVAAVVAKDGDKLVVVTVYVFYF